MYYHNRVPYNTIHAQDAWYSDYVLSFVSSDFDICFPYFQQFIKPNDVCVCGGGGGGGGGGGDFHVVSLIYINIVSYWTML